MLNNIILQLIKMISALYYNDKSGSKDSLIFTEIDDTLKEIKIDTRSTSDLGNEESVIEALRSTVEWMLHNRDGNYDKEILLQTLLINCQGSNEYVGIAKDILNTEVTEDEAENKVLGIMREIRFNKKKNNLKNLMARYNAKLNFSGEYIDVNECVNSITNELANIHTVDENDVPGLLGRIDFSDDNSITHALEKGAAMLSEEGGLNMGLQGLNDSVGGVAPRGWAINFEALTGNYKSTILNDLLLFLPMANKPYLLDPKKTPMFLKISFENTVEQDLIILYKKLYGINYKKSINDFSKIDVEVAKMELKNHFHKHGFHIEVLHYDPSNFTIYDLFAVLNDFIKRGYEIHAMMLDYAHLISHNTIGDRTDTKILKTIEMIRNFCYPKGITQFGAHQISTAFKALAIENPSTFTKKLPGAGATQDCRAIETKLDIEFFLHCVVWSNGNKYLSVTKGKQRLGEHIPESKKSFYYEFAPYGFLPDFDTESAAIYHLPKMVDSEPIDW